MKAVIFREFGPPSVLSLVTDQPKPVRKAGEVLVEVAATSVNPVDWKTRKGDVPRFMVKLPKVSRCEIDLLAARCALSATFSSHLTAIFRYRCLVVTLPGL